MHPMLHSFDYPFRLLMENTFTRLMTVVDDVTIWPRMKNGKIIFCLLLLLAAAVAVAVDFFSRFYFGSRKMRNTFVCESVCVCVAGLKYEEKLQHTCFSRMSDAEKYSFRRMEIVKCVCVRRTRGKNFSFSLEFVRCHWFFTCNTTITFIIMCVVIGWVPCASALGQTHRTWTFHLRIVWHHEIVKKWSKFMWLRTCDRRTASLSYFSLSKSILS